MEPITIAVAMVWSVLGFSRSEEANSETQRSRTRPWQWRRGYSKGDAKSQKSVSFLRGHGCRRIFWCIVLNMWIYRSDAACYETVVGKQPNAECSQRTRGCFGVQWRDESEGQRRFIFTAAPSQRKAQSDYEDRQASASAHSKRLANECLQGRDEAKTGHGTGKVQQRKARDLRGIGAGKAPIEEDRKRGGTGPDHGGPGHGYRRRYTGTAPRYSGHRPARSRTSQGREDVCRIHGGATTNAGTDDDDCSRIRNYPTTSLYGSVPWCRKSYGFASTSRFRQPTGHGWHAKNQEYGKAHPLWQGDQGDEESKSESEWAGYSGARDGFAGTGEAGSLIEYLPDGVPENSKSAEYAYGCSGSLEDAVRVVSKYKRVRVEPGDDPFYEFHAPTICRETKEHGLCDLGRRYSIEEGCTSVLIPYNPCFRIFWRGRNDESTWHANKPVKNEWSLDAFINGCTAPENSLNGSGSPESRTCIRLGASLDHLVPWFGWLYAMQWFGYGHLLLLQAALHLLCRLLFLRFDVGHHATGSELCWHLVRGFAWFAGTCTILTARASCTKKRLQIVQKRRFSIPVLREYRNRQNFGWIMAIAILNNHFVALAHLQSHDVHITQLQTGTVFGTMSSVPGANGSLRADIQGCQPHHFDRGGDLHQGLIPVVRPPQNTHAQLSSSTIDLNFHAIGADGEGRAIVALASETTNEATRIVIYGHQFKDRAHGPRHTRSLSFRPSVVQLQARALWEDFCTQEPCPVYMLEQQPIQRAQHLEVHFIVELTIRQEAYNYALVDVLVEENFLRRTTIAMHHLTAVTDAIDAIFPGEACQPNGIHLCMVEHDGRRYRRSDEVHIPHASYMHVHRCSLATSFNFHPNIFGLHDVATIVYEKGPGFTAEIFRIRHHVKGRRGASQCVSEFRGQDLLSPDTFLQGISCIDIESTVGGLVADNNTNRHDEEFIEFQFSWEHLDSDEDVMHDEVHLQQTGISTIVQAPKVPDVVFRYDPDEFDQERDTVLDEATYPIPETPNDELDLPPRHRWRNYQALWTAIQTVRATHPDVFRLDTYGLRNRYISNRIIEVFSTDMGTIMRSIATTWAEYALGEHMNVYFVSPQPADTPPATITLVIEFPTQEWDFMVSRAVLIDSFVDNIPAGRQAEYIDAQGPARGVALATGYRPRCRPSGVDYCYVTSRGSSFLLHEEIWANHGDYKLFHLDSFEIINAQVLVNFPSGRAFATDFRWRSNHYNQQGFTLHIHSIAGQDRAAPIHLERDITNFLDINFLWQQVLEATSHIGTTDRSVLHQVWPQNVYHASQSAIHLVLDVFPNFPMTPVLVSIVVQAGGQRAERIETRAHQLPPRISILHFMGLVGYSSFAQHFAVDACVSHAGRQFRGENHTLQLTVGGNYELRIQTPPFVDFIHSVANTVQRLETVPAEESESDRPTPDSENDDMDLSQRSLRTHSPFGINLLQTAMLLISPHLAATSFTESFINRSWPAND